MRVVRVVTKTRRMIFVVPPMMARMWAWDLWCDLKFEIKKAAGEEDEEAFVGLGVLVMNLYCGVSIANPV